MVAFDIRKLVTHAEYQQTIEIKRTENFLTNSTNKKQPKEKQRRLNHIRLPIWH